ncbi:SGNH/GDSL hydrolase family protein [Pinirhizobacter sp.]|jgi:lysophospholipase L1-like esterase|uniref:SGNH/GDSL hydrolase family protein n=1 Tax=Pinirhizobacter sp. TaxID=2950432 RepID=UPI002F3E5758
MNRACAAFALAGFLLMGSACTAVTPKAQGTPAVDVNAKAAAAPAGPTSEERLAEAQKQLADWPQLARYHADNAAVNKPAKGEQRVVFMGDSITDFWGRDRGVFFPGKPYINRGISGQTTPQMLVRFRADVVALKPRAVLILAGTNDIAGNTGKASVQMIEDNLASMVDIARANHIKVILATLLPVSDYFDPNQSRNRPPETINELNAWIRHYTRREHLVLLDYYPAMLDEQGVFKKSLTFDGLHPNAAGYDVMRPLAAKAIAKALGK